MKTESKLKYSSNYPALLWPFVRRIARYKRSTLIWYSALTPRNGITLCDSAYLSTRWYIHIRSSICVYFISCKSPMIFRDPCQVEPISGTLLKQRKVFCSNLCISDVWMQVTDFKDKLNYLLSRLGRRQCIEYYYKSQ